jgi:hypothetical protein
MPVRLIKEYLHTVHNLTISVGEIVELLHRMVEAAPLKQEAATIKEKVREREGARKQGSTW